MKKLIRISAPIIVLLAGFAIVQGLVAAKPEPEKKEEPTRLISLYVDEVKSETVTVTVRTQGEVRPKTEIDLVPQVSGRIMAMSESFNEGAEFMPGEMLFKIDDADYRLAVIRAEARVAEAQTELERQLATAKIKEEEWRDERSKGVPTPFALNQTQVAQARAGLRAAEADLRQARLNLERTDIRVPFRGRVAERSVGIGQYVTAGAVLGRVFSTDIVEVRLPLTDAQLGELNLSMGFTAADAQQAPPVRFTAQLGNQQYEWHGHISRVNASVDKETRLIYATAEVAEPYGLAADRGMPLAVGLFVNAEIEGVGSTSALVLPRVALRNENKVYVINDHNRLEIRTVEVMSTSEERVLVRTGVSVGDRVVTSTLPAPVDGMEVQAIYRQAQS